MSVKPAIRKIILRPKDGDVNLHIQIRNVFTKMNLENSSTLVLLDVFAMSSKFVSLIIIVIISSENYIVSFSLDNVTYYGLSIFYR